MRSALFVLFASLASGPLAAQSNARVVPADLATTSGNQDSVLPLTLGVFRFQQIYEGSAITPSGAALTDLSFRRGTVSISAYNGVALPNVVVLLGTTKVAPAGISTTFSANVGSGQTTVFSATWNLPAQPMQSGLGPFNVTLKFAQPYPYLRGNGHLLLEIQAGGTSTANIYAVDASTGVGGGTVRNYGSAGVLKGGTYGFGSTVTGLLTRGGRAVLELTLSSSYPVIGLFGLSDRTWGPVALPLDLTPFGAPGNQLLTSIDLAVPMPANPAGNAWSAVGMLALPDVPAAAGATLYGQAVIAHPASNGLGLVLTDGVALTTPAGTVAPYAAIFGLGPGAQVGYYLPLANASPGGIVTRFGGVFP